MDRADRMTIFLSLGFIVSMSIINNSHLNSLRNKPDVIFIEAEEEKPELIPEVKSQPYTIREFTVTAYCPCEKCCGKWADGIFYDGTKCGGVAIAADRAIPIGTVMDVPGYGKAIVRDRGGAIKGSKLDVYFDSHQDALNWGVHKKVKVKVYDKI
jgi:3D (Asp-Asp-Asp) domain-containing protein